MVYFLWAGVRSGVFVGSMVEMFSNAVASCEGSIVDVIMVDASGKDWAAIASAIFGGGEYWLPVSRLMLMLGMGQKYEGDIPLF